MDEAAPEGLPSRGASQPCKKSRVPTLAEPVTIASWWKNRGGEVIRVRLLTYEGQNIVDVRTWWTDRDGVLKPGKRFRGASEAHHGLLSAPATGGPTR